MEDNYKEQFSRLEEDKVETVVSEENESVKKVVSITEAAKINNVTRQAIYVAIKQNKLKSIKKNRWEIDLTDLENYRMNKYSRSKSVFDGEPLFDNERGYYSVNQVAVMLNVPAQKIYYATRSGMLKGTRKGAAWIIHKDSIEAYKEEYLGKKNNKQTAA